MHLTDSDSCVQRLNDLGCENQYLRTIIAEQEEQIQRLSNALIGNKSHFAKFVEVKTENLSLQVVWCCVNPRSCADTATVQAKLDAVAKANNKYGAALLSGAGGAHTNSAQSAMPSVDGGGSMLPAYQRMKTNIQITNSNMRIIEQGAGGNPPAAARGSVLLQNTGYSVPTLPLGASSGDRSPRAGSSGRNEAATDTQSKNRLSGSKLASSTSRNASPRLSGRHSGSEGLMVGFTQQPHPPSQQDSEGVGTHSAENSRKSMRLNRSSFGAEPSSGLGGHPPIVPGVPLLGKQTRDSLKERLVI